MQTPQGTPETNTGQADEDFIILVDLDGYGNPEPVDARTLNHDTLYEMRYEADTEALAIINKVLGGQR